MDEMFENPLHGVVCRPWSSHSQLEHELQVTFKKGLEPKGNLIWQGTQQGKQYKTNICLFKNQQEYWLKIDCQGKGLFRIEGNQFDIDWQSEGTPASHYFQSMGLALWLELNNVLCLHGNALSKGNKTIVLLAPSGTGKSTLSSALMEKGYRLLTDDMVALHKTTNGHYAVYPSWPIMRMWPDSVEYFAQDKMVSGKVHSAFSKKIIPTQKMSTSHSHFLTDIIVLHRTDIVGENAAHQVSSLTGFEGIFSLLKNAILGEVFRPLNIEKQRLEDMAAVVENVPIKHLKYPSGALGIELLQRWFSSEIG